MLYNNFLSFSVSFIASFIVVVISVLEPLSSMRPPLLFRTTGLNEMFLRCSYASAQPSYKTRQCEMQNTVHGRARRLRWPSGPLYFAAVVQIFFSLFFSFFSPPNLPGRSVDRHQTLDALTQIYKIRSEI